MSRIRTSLPALLACLLAVAQGQEIIFNAVVEDRKGAPAKGLTAADFELTDGGSAVRPVVRMIDGPEVVEGEKRGLAEPLRRLRLITLVFEGMDNEQRRLAKQVALDLLKEDKDPLHLFSVYMVTNQLSLLAPFTADRGELRKAIDAATSGTANTRFAEMHQQTKARLAAAAAASQKLSEADVAPEGLEKNAAVQGALARLQLGMLSSVVIDNAEGSRRSLTYLSSLATGLRTHPGRKAIAYLTWGMVVPTNLDAAFEALQARANSAGVSFYPIDCRGVNVDAQNAGVSQAVARNSATIADGTENRERGDRAFGIDNAVEAMRFNVQSALRTLAETTGGVMMIETNDPKKLLRQMIADVQTYYELIYEPQIKDFNGAFRKTALKVKSGDYRVRDRSGYLAMPPGEENLLPYELPLLKALAAAPPPREVVYRSGTWKLQSGKEVVGGVVALEVPFAGVSFAQDAAKGLYAARIGMIAQIKDAAGKIVERYSRDLPLKGNLDQLEALKNSNFNFRETFTVPVGRYVVESAVIDQLSGKVAARKSSFIAMPDPTGLSMSSITLVRSFQPNVKGMDADDPFVYQGGRITPTLDNNVTAVKGGVMALYFTVYPDKTNAAPVQAVVQYMKDGEVAGSATLPLPPPDAQGRIRYVLSSPMDAMKPGQYEVKVGVKQGPSAVAESVFLNVGTP